MTLAILFAPECGCNPLSNDSTVFNENRITSLMAALTLSVNEPIWVRLGLKSGMVCVCHGYAWYRFSAMSLNIIFKRFLYIELFCVSVGTSSEADALLRTIMEANLSSEVALIVLDVVSLYTQHFKVNHLTC